MKNVLLFLLTFYSFQLFTQWESLGSGISDTPRDVFSISVPNENTIWAVAFNPVAGVSNTYTRSIDGGTTWTAGSLPFDLSSYYILNVNALDENTAWMVAVVLPSQNHSRIFKTIDGGQMWTEQLGEFNDDGHAVPTVHFFNENEGLSFGSSGTGNPTIDSLQIFHTSTGGNTWSRVPPSTLPTPLAGEGQWIYSGNNSYEVVGDTLWFTSRAGRIFRTIDKGATWDAFSTGFSTNQQISSVAFSDASNGIAVAFQSNQAALTSDGGETWSMSSNMPSLPLPGAVEYIPDTENIYMVIDGLQSSGTVAITKDGGQTWEQLFFSKSMDCIEFLTPNIGFGGAKVDSPEEGGIYKWTGNLLDTVSAIVQIDLAAEIFEIAPNPARDFITISNLSDTDFHSVIIVDSQGKELRELQRVKAQNASTFSISNLAKGIYFLTVKVETGEQWSRKFLKE